MNEKRCYECDHCGMDMDMDPYCVQPEVMGAKNRYGLYTKHARAYDGACGPEAKLWEPRKPRTLSTVK